MIRYKATKNKNDLQEELEKIKIGYQSACSEFNNVCDELHINAAIFRLCELETRRSIILKQLRGKEV